MFRAETTKPPSGPAIAGTALAGGVLVGQVVVETHAPAPVAALALVLLATAVPLIAVPFWHLPRYGDRAPGHPYYATTRLVDRGIYRLVRHPQYVGYALLVVGFGALRPHPVVIGLAGGAAVLFCLQAIAEERALQMKWPAAYEAYMRRVPRFNVLGGAVRMLRERRSRARG